MHKLTTKRGYDFYEVSSALQKAIRRADARVAGYFALELYHSGFWKYVWKRLFVISAEDCYGAITQEILSLYEGFKIVNEGRKDVDKGRIFISKAVLLLVEAKHSRDSDHLQNYIYDRAMVSDEEVAKYLEETLSSDAIQVPEYTFDCHTLEGKKRGKTKSQFFLEEYEALANKQKGLFDSVIYD